MIELKPCPLCGNNAEVKQTSKNGMRIKCNRCRFGIGQRVLRYSLEWLENTLISEWNTRPTEEKLRQRIAKLELVCGAIVNSYYPRDCIVELLREALKQTEDKP